MVMRELCTNIDAPEREHNHQQQYRQQRNRPLHAIEPLTESLHIGERPIQMAGWAFRFPSEQYRSYMNFMNLSLASSITCAVMVANPRSLAIRSTSLRAMGRIKSGMFSNRCSASRDHVMPSGE